jgi:hypothetical protein
MLEGKTQGMHPGRFKIVEAHKVKTTYPNPPHKHAELIKVWADGAEIEYYVEAHSQCPKGEWVLARNPGWVNTMKYRIKPQKTAKDIKLEELEAQARKLADEIKELRDA